MVTVAVTCIANPVLTPRAGGRTFRPAPAHPGPAKEGLPMDAAVGARWGTIAPRRRVRWGDLVRIVVRVGLPAGVNAWLVVHTTVPARDAIGFARQSVGLGNPGTFVETVRHPENKQHP